MARMRIKSVASKQTWCDAKDAYRDASLLEDAVRHLLSSDELLILAGLGTSLGIEAVEGLPEPPSMDALWSGVEALDPDRFLHVREAVHFPSSTTDIEDLLSRCQSYLDVNDDAAVRDFVASAESEIARLCRFVSQRSDLPTHTSFLRKFCRRSAGQARTKVFTTNYDLAFEYAAAQVGMVVIDGFSFTEPRSFDAGLFEYDIVRRADPPEYAPNVFQLYKLHGSVDWEREDGATRRNARADQPLLIYPRASKFQFSYQPPFFDMMASLQAALRRPNLGVLAIGFGFRDPHVVQPLMTAIRTNPSLTCMVVSPGVETAPSQPVRHIGALIDEGDGRHCLVAGSFADFVAQVPELYVETHAEIQAMRMRRAGIE